MGYGLQSVYGYDYGLWANGGYRLWVYGFKFLVLEFSFWDFSFDHFKF